jgi:plasmid maintenance system antidote protein VapI
MHRAHNGEGAPVPVGLLLKHKRGSRSQADLAAELEVTQPRLQRWEALIANIDADREVHYRLSRYLGLSAEAYAQSVLEHSLRVRERRL